MDVVEVELSDGGDWLLAGELEAEVYIGGQILGTRSQFPPGSPQRPPTKDELLRKVEDCLVGASLDPDSISWESAADILRRYF